VINIAHQQGRRAILLEMAIKELLDNSDDMCYHECPNCGYRCNCSDQPCSCCNDDFNKQPKCKLDRDFEYCKIWEQNNCECIGCINFK